MKEKYSLKGVGYVVLFLEFLLIFLFLYVLYQNREDWVLILIFFLLGLSMEVIGVDVVHAYTYKGFLTLYSVPIAIPLAWSVILYTSFKLVRSLGGPLWFLPFASAFFTVLLDLAMDPVMSSAGVWTWLRGLSPSDFFGVPLYNFWGWFLAGFVAGLCALKHKDKRRGNRSAFVLYLLYVLLWFPLMWVLRYVPYLLSYYLFWGLILIIGIFVRIWGFTKEVVSLDVVLVRWSFYLASLIVFVWSGLYVSQPYLVSALVSFYLIEIFVSRMYDVL